MADIYDRDGKKVGSKNGEEIYVDDKLVGRVRGDELIDTDGRVLGKVSGETVLDADGNQIFDLKDGSVWDRYSGNEDAKAEEKEALPAAAFYSLLKKNNNKQE